MTAPMIVFLHGLGGSPFTWEEQTSALPPRWQAAAPWLRGLRPGTSGAAEDFTVESAAGDVARTLEFDGPGALVGQGLGAQVALRCALERPDLVVRLVLVSPAPSPGRTASTMQRLLLGLVPSKRFAGGRPSKERLAQIVAEAGREDTFERAGEVATPTLLLVGTRDRVGTPAAQRLESALPDARLAAIDGAGPDVMRTHRTEFNDAVFGFVRGNGDATPQ